VDLEDSDLQEWRCLPVSRLLLEHLQHEADSARKTIAVLVQQNVEHEAKIASGGLLAIETLWGVLHPPKKPVEVPEPPFVDPALR
jgi:hypothetical protein